MNLYNCTQVMLSCLIMWNCMWLGFCLCNMGELGISAILLLRTMIMLVSSAEKTRNSTYKSLYIYFKYIMVTIFW